MLADFIQARADEVTVRWEQEVTEHLGLKLDESQLIDDLPTLLDDLIAALRSPSGSWPARDGAELHGRQRVKLGMDIASLAEEMAILQSSIVGLAHEHGLQLSSIEIQQLIRALGRGTALAVGAYFQFWEKQRTDEVAQHFAFVAHQIRNPLNSAALIAELLTMVPDEQREGHIVRLRRSLTRLSKLVDDSLIDARLRGEPELELQSVTIEKLVEDAYNEIAFHAQEREVVLERQLETIDWEVDPKLMLSAFTNLFSTAVKFSCRGGRIRVRASAQNGHVQFVVEDLCGGLPEDFQLFQPVKKKEYRTGFGLGLSLVKQVVEAHHGKIDVHNNPGEGCSFVLDIPRSQARH